MMKQKLPKDWVVLGSKSHPSRIYYFNVKTNQSSWERPTEEQSKQLSKKSVELPKKRKKGIQGDDNEIKPSTLKQDVSVERAGERKKLLARRSIRQTQGKVTEEKVEEAKVNEGNETPQMRILREKSLKAKEMKSPKSPKDNIKVSPAKSDKRDSLVCKLESSTNSDTVYTPQMKAILEKMQQRKSVFKKAKESRSNTVQAKVEKPITSRQLRNKGKKDAGEKPNEESVSTEVMRIKRGRKQFKKNLGKERMEKLRKSVTSEIDKDEDLDLTRPISVTSTSTDKQNKIPSICKNAEVRLVRLKSKLSKEKKKSPEESVTTVDDLIERSNENAFHEEMDWEPMEDEKISHEVQAVRTQLCTGNNKETQCNVPSNVLRYSLVFEQQQEKKQVYIVVDTNVFLSNIEIIDLVRETTFKTCDKPLIVIPWTVIRELDYIKDDNGRTKSVMLCAKARKAVNYINKLFSLKHPRIIGQTAEDVKKNKEKFAVNCPDDEILQTCLQIRDLGKLVVLLSYDINLCTKAMIYDIVTLGRNDPFEKIDYLNAFDHVNKSLSDSHNHDRERSSLGFTSIFKNELSTSSEIFEDTKSIIRDFLTVIVSREMHSLYGDSWEKYVLRKPPWTTITVLQCAVKHWIAAVSESFLRRAETLLKELLEIFTDLSGEVTLKETSYVLDKCHDLVQMVNIDKYPDLALRVSTKINELLQKCHDYEIRVKEQKLHDEIGIEYDIEEQERRAQKAFRYFEAAYVYARDMCGLAAEIIGMPCSFHYNTPNPLPAVDYVKQTQPELAANVNRLLCSLSAAIEQVKNSRIDYRILNDLHQTLVTFIPEVGSIASRLDDDLVPLDVYCCVKRKEEVLKTGLRQLQDLSTHFCRTASYRCT